MVAGEVRNTRNLYTFETRVLYLDVRSLLWSREGEPSACNDCGIEARLGTGGAANSRNRQFVSPVTSAYLVFVFLLSYVSSPRDEKVPFLKTPIVP